MSRHSIKKEEEKTDINISPMIDMVFILLIFFIVTTVFVEEQGIEADRPQPGANSQQDEENEPIKLRIASNGQIFCNDQEIQSASIRSKVEELLRKADVPVIIDVEEGVVSGKMIMMIDESRNGGADKVLVNTAQKRS
ncbi:MAG: biopolymer transporter ExbD [Opitutales bacterium]|nr:biopolymer transporter ExbD [Opitutales bacterium]